MNSNRIYVAQQGSCLVISNFRVGQSLRRDLVSGVGAEVRVPRSTEYYVIVKTHVRETSPNAREKMAPNATLASYSVLRTAAGAGPATTVLLFVLGDDFSNLNAPKGRPMRVGRVLAPHT